MILIYKRFNPRNATKWGAPKRARCMLLQTPRETQRSKLQSICCRQTLPGHATAGVPAGSAPAHHGSGAPRCDSVPTLGHRQVEGDGEGCMASQHPRSFFSEGATHPILSKTCFPFLLSALLPPLLLPARPSRSAPVILSSFPSTSQRRSVSPKHPVKLRPRSEPSSVWQSRALGPCACVFLTSIYYFFLPVRAGAGQRPSVPPPPCRSPRTPRPPHAESSSCSPATGGAFALEPLA